MKPLPIQLDERTPTALNRIAVPGGCKRSEFVRKAIRQATRQAEYRAMREAYRKQPDSILSADVWSTPRTTNRNGPDRFSQPTANKRSVTGFICGSKMQLLS